MSCVLGMTKVKVGKEDLSSVEFVEKRRSALERYETQLKIFLLQFVETRRSEHYMTSVLFH